MVLFVKLAKINEELPGGDYRQFRLHYEYIPKKFYQQPEEGKETIFCELVIKISRSLEEFWGLKGRALEAQLVEFAKKFIEEEIKNGTLSQQEELFLKTDNTQLDPPYPISLENCYMPWGYDVKPQER